MFLLYFKIYGVFHEYDKWFRLLYMSVLVYIFNSCVANSGTTSFPEGGKMRDPGNILLRQWSSFHVFCDHATSAQSVLKEAADYE